MAKRGIWNCGLVPFGYDYDAAAKLLSPNPREAAIVKRIYAEAARLRSLTDIANRLTEEGVRTRQRIFKRRPCRRVTVGGKAIKSDWLRHLIKNPIYSGRVRLKGHANTKPSSRLKHGNRPTPPWPTRCARPVAACKHVTRTATF